MTKEEKKDLKKKLPFGWAKIIAKETNFSPAYARRVMDGLADKYEIELAVLNLAKDHESKLKKLEQLKNNVL